MISIGIDCGARNTKTAILNDGIIRGRGIVQTGFDQSGSVTASLDMAMKEAGISYKDITCIGGTGSGAKAVYCAHVTISHTKAIVAAVHYFCPDARTVVDVGAEEARAVQCDEQGLIIDFAVNEKCAAGAGAFLEAMARALETPLEEMGSLALSSDKNIDLNSQCTIFAESEVVGLIHARVEKKDISKAIHDAMAARTAAMIRRIGVHPEIVMIGGVARNRGFVTALERELGMKRIIVPESPEFGGAVGAALATSKECC